MRLANHSDGLRPRNDITVCHLPTHIDKEQPPVKKEPFETVVEHQFCHTVTVLLPTELEPDGLEHVLDRVGPLHYAKVHMKLGEVVQGDFFHQHIKSGNLLMLSEGRPGIDNVFSLREGVLRLEIDKPTFERMGLDGRAIPTEGRKHIKARYAVEVNLRLPSMVRGKKGFERVLWAFKHVLIDTATWLVCNFKDLADFSGPIAAFAPIVKTVTPIIGKIENANVPGFTGDYDTGDPNEIVDQLEWLSLAVLDSPRILKNDSINTYLSRYRVPNALSSLPGETTAIARLQWRGLVNSVFITALLGAMLRASSAPTWFAFSAQTFDGKAYTILKTGKQVVVSKYAD